MLDLPVHPFTEVSPKYDADRLTNWLVSWAQLLLACQMPLCSAASNAVQWP